MPLAWAVRRSTAKWVLPVLVGPRTALTGWDEGDGMVFMGGDAGMGGVAVQQGIDGWRRFRSEEHTSELQSLMRISYAVFCLKKKTNIKPQYFTKVLVCITYNCIV